MFSARLVVRLARFHGQRSATSGGRPTAVNQPRTGQLPVASAIARMPSRGTFSTGLPSTQPTARPSQAPRIRSGSTGSRRDRVGGGEDRLELLGLLGGERASGSRRARRAARARAPSARRATGSCEAPRVGAGRPPAPSQRRSISSTSLPSSRACRSSWPTRSSGWIQVTLKPCTAVSSAIAFLRRSNRAASLARISCATAAIVRPGSSRSSRLAAPISSTHSRGTGEPSAAASAPPIDAIESESRP